MGTAVEHSEREPRTVRFTVVGSPLGPVSIAATPAGVCRVEFGEASEVFERTLRVRFPCAQVVRDDAACAEIADAIRALVSGRDPGTPIPIDEGGTPFQRAVWAELRRIPRGSTTTYDEVAQRIGRPGAARAVARACAANPLAVLTPCHRVIRADRSLGGYRWGTARKQALLAAEGTPGGLPCRREEPAMGARPC